MHRAANDKSDDSDDNKDNKDNELNEKGDRKRSEIFNETVLRQIELFMLKSKRLFLRLKNKKM